MCQFAIMQMLRMVFVSMFCYLLRIRIVDLDLLRVFYFAICYYQRYWIDCLWLLLLLRSVRMSDERDRDSIEADLAALLRDSVTGDVGWKSTDTCRHWPAPAHSALCIHLHKYLHSSVFRNLDLDINCAV